MKTSREGRRPLSHFLSLPYRVQLIPEQEGGFTVMIPDLPGCISQGESAEEALANIQDAKKLWLEVAYQHGDSIPLPASEEGYSGKVLLRMPITLHRKLAEGARKEQISLNQYLVALLSENNAYRRVRQDIRCLSDESGHAHGHFEQILAQTQSILVSSGIYRWETVGAKEQSNYRAPKKLMPVPDMPLGRSA
jgi:predicted RNase H-like HicB family nuclease